MHMFVYISIIFLTLTYLILTFILTLILTGKFDGVRLLYLLRINKHNLKLIVVMRLK